MKVDSGGVSLDVEVEGEGRPVVLLHGFPESKRSWSKVVPGLRDAPSDPVELAQAWHDATMATVEPWYRDTVEFDEARLAEIDAQINGEEFEPDDRYATRLAMQAAAGKDPEVLRGVLAVANAVTLPQDVLADAALRDKVLTLGANWRAEPLPGLSRADLLAAVAG